MSFDGTDVVIGIDLGTTNCCVGTIRNDDVIILHNSTGENLTPSCVMFQENGIQIVGSYAQDFAFENARNTVYNTKRIIGRLWNDPLLQRDRQFWPFSVSNSGEYPWIKACGTMYQPEQVAAKILRHLKNEAEKTIGCGISKAVITVPAYFTNSQRQATMDAASIADLSVLELLNEPTAAAIAYEKQRFDQSTKNVVVYDLGGGTFDVAVIQIQPSDIQVLAIDGDTHLGGEDFDQRIFMHIAENLGIAWGNHQVSDSYHEQQVAQNEVIRVKRAAEQVKKMLSMRREASVPIVIRNREHKITITREWFNEVLEDVFQKTIQIVERALVAAKRSEASIQDIIMVGGSSRIPRIQELLMERFPNWKLNFNINPDEAVAYGATLRASQLISPNSMYKSLQVHDITAMAFGTDSIEDKYVVLLPKGSPIPCKSRKGYRTSVSWQTTAKIAIFQGDHTEATQNTFLGDITLSNIPQRDQGEEVVEVIMEISKMGILTVTAEILSSGSSKSFEFDCKKGRLTPILIQRYKKLEQECLVTPVPKPADEANTFVRRRDRKISP